MIPDYRFFVTVISIVLVAALLRSRVVGPGRYFGLDPTIRKLRRRWRR